jgi:hypothetical protein
MFLDYLYIFFFFVKFAQFLQKKKSELVYACAGLEGWGSLGISESLLGVSWRGWEVERATENEAASQ